MPKTKMPDPTVVRLLIAVYGESEAEGALQEHYGLTDREAMQLVAEERDDAAT